MDQAGKFYATWNYEYGDEKSATSPQDFIGPYDTEADAVNACIELCRDIARDSGEVYSSRFYIVRAVKPISVCVDPDNP